MKEHALARVAELVETIRVADHELQRLLEGQTDAKTRMGMLNALPAHIALLDGNGVIMAEDAVRAREEQQRQLAETLAVETRRLHESQAVAKVGSWETNLSTFELSWTDETYRIFEVSPAEFVPTHQAFLRLVHPDDRAKVDAAFQNSQGKSETFSLEHRICMPDGRVKFVEERWQAFDDESGQAVRAVGTCQDITERKQSEELQRQNQSLLRIAGRVAKLGGWSVDLPENTVRWSDETALIHDTSPGYSPSLADAISFYPPEWRNLVSTKIEALRTEGTPLDFELELITAKQRRIWVRAIGEAERDDAGQIVRLAGAFQDITERKVADLALIASNRALTLRSRCNESVIRAESESRLLSEVCRIAADIGGYCLAWVGYARDDAARTIDVTARSGEATEYLDNVQLSWDATVLAGQGPAGRVIRGGHAVICENIEADESFRPWRDRALQHGLRGVICLPLRSGEHTFGLMGLYTVEANYPDLDERRLLQEMADDLAFGITHLRSQHARRQMEAAVMRVATSVSASVGSDFFQKLAVSVAEAVGANGAYLARPVPGDPDTARTVAAVVDGLVIENFDYAVRGTPCETLTNTTDLVVPSDVAGQFPESLSLALFRAQAYVGRQLVNAAGQVVGWMFVLFREPLTDVGFVTSTLQIFASRATSEIERLEADSRIKSQATLLNEATDAILVCDLNHRVLFWNRGAENMYGWNAEDAIDRLTPEFLYNDSARFHAAVAAVRDKGVWSGELEIKSRTNSIITAECRWTLVRNEFDIPESILCIETNITERKKLEAQFLRAQRMESVGTLASGIAHDMNNILAPILMSIQLLSEESANEATRSMLKTLESSAQRGADLVRQLLSFARGVESQRVTVDLTHLLRDLQKVMKEVFPKDVEYECTADRDLWTIVGDPSQLHQVLLNLCVNARDAMPRGGKLTIKMENIVLDEVYSALNVDAKVGAYVVVSVIDTGSGIAPSVLERIFEPFFTTKELGRGTGLGLSTVTGIVKNHGGFVNVYSEEDNGTTFKVYLPAQTTETQVAFVSIAQTGIPRGNGELILLVDDEQSIRKIAVKTLVRYGYRVLEAANGAEAVALYVKHQHEVALVVTDVSMPIMDGAALITALKTFSPDVKILVSSGLPTNGDLAKAMGSGVEHFIPKPYTAEKLLGAIYDELHRAR